MDYSRLVHKDSSLHSNESERSYRQVSKVISIDYSAIALSAESYFI
jgi:hypothetical protein